MVKTDRNSAKHLASVFLGTFLVAAAIDFASELFVREVSALVLALLFLLFIIMLHVMFDIIAIAAISADEAPFHAKAANRVKGAGQAVILIRNGDLVANICADVVGDVTGTISGALAAGIVIDILRMLPGLKAYEVAVASVFLALTAAVTVTAKAWGKSYGVNKANEVIFFVAKFLQWIESTTGINILNSSNKRKRGKRT